MNSKKGNSTEITRARKLLEIYQGEVDDFFKLWPPDKEYFFSGDNKSFLAFGVYKKIAICMGEPVGYNKSIQGLLNEFINYNSERKLKPVFIQTTDKYSDEFKSSGFKNILIGADAIIDLDEFVGKTVHNRYFRNIVNRFTNQGFCVELSNAPHNKNIIKDLQKISESWLQIPEKKEWSFLTGKFDQEYLRQVNIYILRDHEGKAVAFTNELPTFKQGVCSIDLMRHCSDSPPNSIDYLFIEFMKIKQAEGYAGMNLGMSPLDAKPFARDISAKLLISAYRMSNKIIGFKGLHQFKSKYKPNWEPRYVWYQGSAASLPKIGIAIAHLMRNGQAGN